MNATQCRNRVFFTPKLEETPGHTVLAADLQGGSPLAAAAADGWSVRYVEDSATSRKHPAQFAVLTKIVDRVHRDTASGGFGSYPSVRAMACEAGSIVVGFDTEFVGVSGWDDERPWVGERADVVRKIVSYQFAAIDPSDSSRLRLAVVLPRRYRGPRGPRMARLSLEKALEIAITDLRLYDHQLAIGWSDKGVSWSEVERDGKRRPSWWYGQEREGVSRALPITLVAHLQHADLTAFVDRRKALNTWNVTYPDRAREIRERAGSDSYRGRWLDNTCPDILRAVISASAGMVSPKPVRIVLPGENWRWARPVELSIRDTMAHSGAERLETLGEAVGVPKGDVPDGWISRMDEYLEEHPIAFLDYAANDAVIALEYVSQVYGDDREVPLSLPTAAASAVRRMIQRSLDGSDFNGVFGGLTKATRNTDATVSHENQLDYYRKRELLPVDGAAATWIHASACSFRGGYNMAAEIGLFDRTTYDLDLKSCYPTSSSTILDVDYLHPDGVIERTVNNAALSLEDFAEHGPLTPFRGFVSFSFPESVAFPCLPVPVEGSMVYPLSSGVARGVWATGPEVWLALCLGASVTCQIGHFARVLRNEDGVPSRLLRGPYRTLVEDRARAKREFGSKSFEQQIIKLEGNSPFGKLAQGVMGQGVWDAWAQDRDVVGGSAITSPSHACDTTGLVRAVLLATLNQLCDLGYSTPSCTTDGLITDAPLEVVDELDLFGLAGVWRESREVLTGSRAMWELKHEQTDLLNITTRANFSRQPGGVLAHGGYKLPEGIVEDSQEDRDHMYDLMVTRDSALPVTMKVFPSLHELTRIENRLDFGAKIVEKELAIEFDRKRRPVSDGMTVDILTVGDEEFEVAHVHTVPWATPEDAVLGRSVDKGLKRWDDDHGEFVWERSPVRRTRSQWLDYLERLDALLDEDGRIADSERLDRIAKGIVIAHRQGVVHIPWLDSARPLADRLDAFEAFGLPRPRERFWSHARSKAERQIEIDLDAITPYVQAMTSTDPFNSKGDQS